jgi:hypothetical protein
MGNARQEQGITAARARPWLIASGVAIGWGILTMTVLHLISSHNPVLDTLSSYAYTDRGSGMFEASVLSLAVGSFCVLGALNAAGITISRTTRILFSTWSLGLATAALFPASYAAYPHPVSGEIHQYSCLVAFLSVPGIGFSLLDGLTGNRAMVTRLSRYSLAGLLLFGASYLLSDFPGTPVVSQLSDALPVGVTQRLALGVDLALLFGLMLLASRAGGLNRLRAVPEQPRQAAGVHEHDLLVGAEIAASGPAGQRRGGLAVVDRFEHNAFRAAEKL